MTTFELIVSILYLASLILQVMAVLFAVRMSRRSALRAPWYMMAAAMTTMAVFRLGGMLASGILPGMEMKGDGFHLFSACLSSVVSLLLFLSLFAIRRLSVVHESAEVAR